MFAQTADPLTAETTTTMSATGSAKLPEVRLAVTREEEEEESTEQHSQEILRCSAQCRSPFVLAKAGTAPANEAPLTTYEVLIVRLYL